MNIRETATEWLDISQAGEFALEPPDSDMDHTYVASKILNWWPKCNVKGAAFFSEDVTPEILNTMVGKLVNIDHDQSKSIGAVEKVAKTSQGVEAIIRIDRQKADAFGIDLNKLKELANARAYSTSIETTRNPSLSRYITYDDKSTVHDVFNEEQSSSLGIRRTTRKDPYSWQGRKVALRLVPERFTGIGITLNPADKDATMYRMTANDSDEEHPVLIEEFTTTPVIKESDVDDKAKIAELEAALKARDEEAKTLRESASTSEAQRKTLKTDLIVRDLEGILKFRDNSEREKLRETASMACDDDGVIRNMKLERTVTAKDMSIDEKDKEIKDLRDTVALLEAAKVETRPGDKFLDTDHSKSGVGTATGNVTNARDLSSKTTGKDPIDPHQDEKNLSDSTAHPENGEITKLEDKDARDKNKSSDEKIAESDAKAADQDKAKADAKKDSAEEHVDNRVDKRETANAGSSFVIPGYNPSAFFYKNGKLSAEELIAL